MAFDFENGSYTDAAGRTVLDPAVYKDWQIGAAAEQALPPVDWFRQKLGLLPEELLPYGKTPKLDFLRIMERLKDRPDGKYIEVTAITPTPLGEGKSTTSLGLIEGLGRLGANVGGCLRQPSGGPTMNVKGTAAGGGNALLIPMTEFSLGLTGDINDIMNAHNLAMTALNARMQHERNYDDETLAKRGLRRLDIDPERVQWSFVLDFCCQALRKMRIGLGEGKMDGYPMDTCANIAVSSELMAILSVARDLEDLRRRIGSIVLAYDKQGRPVTTEDLEVAGAMTAWMRNTINPTLCYTVEHQPVLVHAGPFANIAIGQSSVIGDRLGLKLFDYHVTESGFAADIGFEKFWNVKCRLSGPPPAGGVYPGGSRPAGGRLRQSAAPRGHHPQIRRHPCGVHQQVLYRYRRGAGAAAPYLRGERPALRRVRSLALWRCWRRRAGPRGHGCLRRALGAAIPLPGRYASA